VNLIRAICLFMLSSLSIAAWAGPASATLSPVVFINETVDGNGNQTVTSSTDGVSASSTNFGQLTLSAQTKSLPAAVAMPVLGVKTGTNYGLCAAAAIQSTCVLGSAANWITANEKTLVTAISSWEATYGYTSAWFTYAQQIQLTGESAARTLTWSVFVNAQGVGTYGAPQLSGNSSAALLYVSYNNLYSPAAVAPTWVTNFNSAAGSVVWQLLNPTTMAPLTNCAWTSLGCSGTLTVALTDDSAGSKTGTPGRSYGAFDQLPSYTSDSTLGYKALLGSGSNSSSSLYNDTVAGLLEQTGTSLALVDYSYPIQPQYSTVTSANCPGSPPGGAATCLRPVATYTISKLELNYCDCAIVDYIENGSFTLQLTLLADRNVVSVVSVDSSGSPTLSSQLLQEFTTTAASPSSPFNPNPSPTDGTTVGQWTLPIPRDAANAILNASPAGNLIQPLDGTKTIAQTDLLQNSILLGPQGGPLPSVQADNQNNDVPYWEAAPVGGASNTFRGLELRCDSNWQPQFMAGYNVGSVEASDTDTNGGFVNPVWAAPISPAASGFSSGSGSSSCSGFSFGSLVSSKQPHTYSYWYQLNNGCAPLVATDGPGTVCPASYVLTAVPGAQAGSCLLCGTGQPTATIQGDGTVAYGCSDGSAVAESSPLYAITLSCGAASAAPHTYHYAVINWQATVTAQCGVPTPEAGTLTCVDDTTQANVDPSFCSSQAMPATTMTIPPVACQSGGGSSPTYAWVTSGFQTPINICSPAYTETQTVTCKDQNGISVASSNCTAPQPPSSQTVPVYTGCPYIWEKTSAGSCTVAPGTWLYTNWTPATGCGSFTQSRTVTGCSASGGTQPDVYTCIEQSTGSTMPNQTCTTSMPVTTSACTPTSGSANCTATPDTSNSTTNFDACTYQWVASGFSTCAGATANWAYSAWSPATGCGTNIQQNRTGTCQQVAGSQSQTVSCQRTQDHTTVTASNCSGTAPATTQSCTIPCGTENTQQFQDLTNGCTYTWKASAWGLCTAD
jgi:hypothetical protein